MQASLNCEVRLNESVTQLHRDKARVGVTSTDALGATRVDQYDHVVSTLPSNALATVLSGNCMWFHEVESISILFLIHDVECDGHVPSLAVA